jgi:hypothetical protein
LYFNNWDNNRIFNNHKNDGVLKMKYETQELFFGTIIKTPNNHKCAHCGAKDAKWYYPELEQYGCNAFCLTEVYQKFAKHMRSIKMEEL